MLIAEPPSVILGSYCGVGGNCVRGGALKQVIGSPGYSTGWLEGFGSSGKATYAHSWPQLGGILHVAAAPPQFAAAVSWNAYLVLLDTPEAKPKVILHGEGHGNAHLWSVARFPSGRYLLAGNTAGPKYNNAWLVLTKDDGTPSCAP